MRPSASLEQIRVGMRIKSDNMALSSVALPPSHEVNA
jgi:hypothetical protein